MPKVIVKEHGTTRISGEKIEEFDTERIYKVSEDDIRKFITRQLQRLDKTRASDLKRADSVESNVNVMICRRKNNEETNIEYYENRYHDDNSRIVSYSKTWTIIGMVVEINY